MKTILCALALAAFALPSAANAASSDHAAHAGHAAQDAGALSDATVKKVEKADGRVTLAHGPIANLGMPPMTMTFKVKDPSVLKKVKAGDKVRFRAEEAGGAYVVVRIEPAK